MTCRCVSDSLLASFIHQYSAIEAGLAGTRAQSCDRYGSGTLHPGQVFGGSLPLLSPAFRRSHFCRQVPVRPQRRERSQQRKVELWARKCPVILPKLRLPRKSRGLLHAANLRHGTDGFTSPKEGVLRSFARSLRFENSTGHKPCTALCYCFATASVATPARHDVAFISALSVLNPLNTELNPIRQ